MKPKNKFQQNVVEASKTLPSLTDEQLQWSYRNCIEYIGQRTKKGNITCTHCGHKWQGAGYLVATLCGYDCPHCGTKLMVKTTRKRVFDGCEYFCIITTHEGYQVLRYFMVKSVLKVGQRPKITRSEVMQRWIAPNGKYATFARLRQTMGTLYYDAWLFSTPLELRQESYVYGRIDPELVYPEQRLLPELRRTGYEKPFENLSPFDCFRFLLAESKAETLLKAGQKRLFRHFAYDNSRKTANYWASIRICIRNGYNVQNPSLWCDYIDLLRFFGKDLHNAKYVCPADLKAEHDKYMKKKREVQERERMEEHKREALANETRFQEMKSKFFGIQFSDGLIVVRVLESVAEIMQEGDLLHHCVYTNDYHLKPDSLILSACIDGKRLETIEISLSRLEVLQSRGACNQNTEYHKQIIQLVNKNIPLIEERLAA